MYLTQKNHIRADKKTYKILRILTLLSENLYNFTLYTVKQYYFNNGKYILYEQAYHLVKHSENYRLLPSQVAQQTTLTETCVHSSMFSTKGRKVTIIDQYRCQNIFQGMSTLSASSRRICSRLTETRLDSLLGETLPVVSDIWSLSFL